MDAPSTAPHTPGHRPGVLQEVRSLARELRGLVHDQVGLAALETRRAGESLVGMNTLGLTVGGLLVSTGLGFLAVVMVVVVVELTLIERGVVSSPSAALLLAVGANLLLPPILGWAIRRRRPYLQFPATVRSLSPDTEKSTWRLSIFRRDCGVFRSDAWLLWKCTDTIGITKRSVAVPPPRVRARDGS